MAEFDMKQLDITKQNVAVENEDESGWRSATT